MWPAYAHPAQGGLSQAEFSDQLFAQHLGKLCGIALDDLGTYPRPDLEQKRVSRTRQGQSARGEAAIDGELQGQTAFFSQRLALFARHHGYQDRDRAGHGVSVFDERDTRFRRPQCLVRG